MLLSGVLVLLVSLESWNQTGRVNSLLSRVSVLLPLAAHDPSLGVQVSCPLCSMLAASVDGSMGMLKVPADHLQLRRGAVSRCWHTHRVGWSCVQGGDTVSSSVLPPACPPPVWLFHNPGLTDLSSWD